MEDDDAIASRASAAGESDAGPAPDGVVAEPEHLHFREARVERAAKRARNFEDDLDHVLSAVSGSAQEAVSAILGPEAAEQPRNVESERSLLPEAAPVVCGVRRQHDRLCRRALVSYVHALRRSVQPRLRGCEVLVQTEVIDDASFWLKRPPDEDEARTSRAPRPKPASKKKKGRPGRNTHVPCMNNEQLITTWSPTASHTWRLHSPTLALPKANWGTMYDRRARWVLLAGDDLGRVFAGSPGEDANNEVTDAVPQELPNNIKVILHSFCTDALTTNKCLVAEEQRRCSLVRGGSRIRMVTDMVCQAHQSCLVNRPVYESLGDHPTCLLRLGHVLQSSRSFHKFLDHLDSAVNSAFCFRRVVRLPEEAPIWAKRSKWVLDTVRASAVIDEDTEKDLANHANGDWSMPKWVHYCRGDSCPHGCRDERDSRAKACAIARRCFKGGCPIALLYRWKGVEHANSFCLLGRALHDVLYQALTQMWSKKAIADAEAAVAAADDPDAVAYNLKSAVKGGSVLNMFRRGPTASHCSLAAALAMPTQKYLNRVMRSDKLMCTYNELQHGGATPEKLEEARVHVIQANAKFITGTNGRRTIREIHGLLLQLRGPGWQECRQLATRHIEARMLIKPLCDAWRRFVFYFQQPCYELFGSFLVDGLPVFSEGCLNTLTQKLEDQLGACPQCLDPDFTMEMLRLLRQDKQLAFRTAMMFLETARVGSGNVERSHLVGQELRRNRGRAVEAFALAQKTFVRKVAREQQALRQRVETRALKARGMNKLCFVRICRSFCLRRHGHARAGLTTRKKRVRRARFKQTSKQVRATDSYREFRRREFRSRAKVGTPAFVAEERRVRQKWQQADEVDRAACAGLAEAAAEATRQLLEEGTSRAASSGGLDGVLGKSTAAKLEQSVAAQVISDIAQDSCWDSGLALWSHDSGLKSTEVTMGGTEDEVRRFAEAHFGYLADVVPNRGTSIPNRSCAARCWGVCCRSAPYGQCRIAAHSIHSQLSSWKMAKQDTCRGGGGWGCWGRGQLSLHLVAIFSQALYPRPMKTSSNCRIRCVLGPSKV